MDNENNFNECNNMNNTSDINQNSTINHCRICNASIPQNEKLCENCKSVYATSKSSEDNNTSTIINNQNNSCNEYNQNYNSSINNNTNNNYNNGNFIPNQNPNNYNRSDNNGYGDNKSKEFGFFRNIINSFKTNKSLYIGITIGIVIIVAAIILISNFNSNQPTSDKYDGYKKAFCKGLDMLVYCEPDIMFDLFPDEYYEKSDYDEKRWRQYADETIEMSYEQLIDELGNNVKYSIEFEEEENLSESQYSEVCDYLQLEFDINKNEIGDAYNITGSYTIEGNDDSLTIDFDKIAIQIHNEWYIIEYIEDMDTYMFNPL